MILWTRVNLFSDLGRGFMVANVRLSLYMHEEGAVVKDFFFGKNTTIWILGTLIVRMIKVQGRDKLVLPLTQADAQ